MSEWERLTRPMPAVVVPTPRDRYLVNVAMERALRQYLNGRITREQFLHEVFVEMEIAVAAARVEGASGDG